MNVDAIPYLKKVLFSYAVKTTDHQTNVVTNDVINGELYVSVYMDPEWQVRCYLLAFPLYNDDTSILKELMSLELKGFFGDENGIHPPPEQKEDWFYMQDTVTHFPEVYPEDELPEEEEPEVVEAEEVYNPEENDFHNFDTAVEEEAAEMRSYEMDKEK